MPDLGLTVECLLLLRAGYPPRIADQTVFGQRHLTDMLIHNVSAYARGKQLVQIAVAGRGMGRTFDFSP